MAEINLVGVDIAKSVFQVCAMNSAGEVVLERRLRRAQFERFLVDLEPCRIAMEACGGAHHWGRLAARNGLQVSLYHPKRVAAFVGAHKSDRHDGLAICETARQPTSRSLPVKTEHQQEQQSLNRLRSGLIKRRTEMVNRLRGLLSEHGQCFPKGRLVFMRQIAQWLGDPQGVSTMMVEVIDDEVAELRGLDQRLTRLTGLIRRITGEDQRGQLLMTAPGIGPINASSVLAKVDDATVFPSARHFSAWIGIVPRLTGTGGKVRLGPITKHGDRMLRCNLIHGARSVVQAALRRDQPRHQLEAWIRARHGTLEYNVLVVAVANRLARIVWSILRSGKPYRPRPIAQEAGSS